VKISLLTGGEPHYQTGLVFGLSEQDLVIDVIGDDSLAASPIMRRPRVNFKHLRRRLESDGSLSQKLFRVTAYYLRLINYAARTDSRLIHIQWPYKLVFLDRTVLNVYYKALGKKIVFTAHNVDQGARDGAHLWRNRSSLLFLYKIVDHVIVHTNKMKRDLANGFGISESKVSVIPHGVNCAVPESAVTREEARRVLRLPDGKRALLFFGLISPYKGLEYLITALARLRREKQEVSLVVAGRIKECEPYWHEVCRSIQCEGLSNDVMIHTKHIPDESVEIYFKAADVLIMPYRNIFQSGVLFLAYRFGLPVIATDVGSLREDVIEGKTGHICKPEDPDDLAKTIGRYFASDLFKDLENRRQQIRDYAHQRYSWSRIGEMTRKVYEKVMKE